MMLDNRVTQAEFAELVGVTQPRVAQLIANNVLPRDGTARAWLRMYCERLRAEAAGRADSELSSARARLADAQAQRAERRNKVESGEFAAVGLLEVVLSHVARQIVARLDSLVPQIKRRVPDMPAAALATIEAELAACRTLCANANIADAERLEREEASLADDASDASGA